MKPVRSVDPVYESDRGCLLVAAAEIESCLEKRFRSIFDANHIPKKIQDSIFDANGPLSTFSAKAKLAFSFRLISKEAFGDLEAIRKIRNIAAHSSNEFDISEGKAALAIESLSCTQPIKKQLLRRYNLKRSSQENNSSPNPSYKEKILMDAEVTLAGFLKYHKALFVLGIGDLKFEIENGMSLEQVTSLIKINKTPTRIPPDLR